MPTDPAFSKELAAAPRLRIPNHLGVIMDGNGRWATARGKKRTEGHLAGVRALRGLVELCINYGVPNLTVFSFSSENWSRPAEEVSFIFSLLRRFVASDLQSLIRNNVHVRVIGSREGLDPSLVRLIRDAEQKTAANTGLNLIVAFNYGSKAELTEATRAVARAVARGELDPESITEETIAASLYTTGLPDPDLIVRTSGEQRISNFLLWQAAYAELVFVDEYWPDFNEATFLRVLETYALRDRRFGGIEARIT
ncbi:polyprenyl diphosphate synthase [Devosia nitrariae]|uniref:Isoprenyl transferase n=1 Tax=Devosia nitrariae TaxID=2071872 RepID=A0ABQ5WDM0_9HYPH|nr:polyprenyl diphosphate synthase [Devosia nitrariae]GLQ57818.1 isoprenyl transferase [Devosia nitrariae]